VADAPATRLVSERPVWVTSAPIDDGACAAGRRLSTMVMRTSAQGVPQRGEGAFHPGRGPARGPEALRVGAGEANRGVALASSDFRSRRLGRVRGLVASLLGSRHALAAPRYVDDALGIWRLISAWPCTA